MIVNLLFFFFFFQAEDGIRDGRVTGVQTCALPIYQLKLRRFRSLHSRLHWRLHIDQLTPEDTAEYLRYRMKRAGCDRDVFTQDAVQMLHEAATGGMRDLDRLATGCLREAARKKRKLVERDLLPRVLDRDGLERDR